MAKINLPNFMCIGAAKCATTSLYNILKQHPQIGLSSFKEPHFFDDHNNFKKGNKLYFGKEYGFIKKFMNKIKNFPYNTSFLKVNRCEENL